MEELVPADFKRSLNFTNPFDCDLNDNKVGKVERMSGALRKLGGFLQPALTFLNCHFADYYLKSYWNTYVPQKLRRDLEKKSLEEVKKCLTDLVSDSWKKYPEYEQEVIVDFEQASTLEQLVVSVGKLRLSELNLSTDHRTFLEKRKLLKGRCPRLFVDLEFDKFMSSKKMHEVMMFSEFIACASEGVIVSSVGTEPELEAQMGRVKVKRGQGLRAELRNGDKQLVRHIVDVGSGKGYLSSFLALYYDLKVLAIDASASNTEGCEKRLMKLDKYWPQLVRRAKERRDTGSVTQHGKNWRKKLSKMGISWEEYQSSLVKEAQRCENNLKSVTALITTKTDLEELVDSNLSEDKVGCCEKETETTAAGPIRYGIVGLHTCGNLGANILKLFLHNERAQFICVVPCCYNLVREDESLYPETTFYGSKFGLDEEGSKSGPWPDGSIGFPLSDTLKYFNDGKAFVVGRNARMLSAYSLPRMMESDGAPLDMPPVLYYRALLQVFLKRHGLLPENPKDEENDIRVGRMTKKCPSFKDYVVFALKKLGIDGTTIIDDGSIEDIERTFASPEMLDKFHKYYLLRTLFSSVIEDLILLDRLVFLLDQDSVRDAHIVQLFDPALSPRSHAIVAFKR